MLAMGKDVVETHEFDLDGVWLSPAPVAIVLLSNGFEEGLGTDVINDGAIGRFMRPNVTFANRFFDQVFRASAWLVTQKGIVLAAQEISAVKSGQAQERRLRLGVAELLDLTNSLFVGHCERLSRS